MTCAPQQIQLRHCCYILLLKNSSKNPLGHCEVILPPWKTELNLSKKTPFPCTHCNKVAFLVLEDINFFLYVCESTSSKRMHEAGDC